ncbi:tRNA (N6-isopentenyl adenosine(37)-C2)-methylthiotransferase MiaB [Fundidesulfovibrio magnetotacticus]|nr:tRNA (N6-isopentenyl adenosine(37)-C2)-methylthiotransferase MiaB [Fundidesulfovibrio magnetotacticus]
MKFHVITFGCQMNVADSGWLGRSLTAMGWEEVPEDEARVFVVNTCSVREKPELKLYSQLGRLAAHLERDPSVFCAVGGCVAQQVGTSLWNRFPFVRLVFGTDGIPQAPQALARLAENPRLRLSLLDFSDSYTERDPALPETAPRPSAFVTIMQGCDNYCAYCIVPYVRGRQKSRAFEGILEECRALARSGVLEITLLGQNVNSYGKDLEPGAPGFPELLRAVASIEGIRRLRFTTSHPKDLDPGVIAAFGELPQLCPSLHLPAQSGSDAVLGRMGRRYTSAEYMAKVEALRAARPDILLTTDLIVGFPGETEEDFQATLELIRRAGFECSFSFMYCDRPGVAAARMEPKLSDTEKARRLAVLQALQNEQQEAMLARLTGSVAQVLVEGPGERRATGEPAWRGRDASGRVVNFFAPDGERLVGSIAPVRITQSKKHSLWGEAIP